MQRYKIMTGGRMNGLAMYYAIKYKDKPVLRIRKKPSRITDIYFEEAIKKE